MKILIVDDHPIFRSGLVRILTAEFPSVETSEASSGTEALLQMRKQDFQIVILDMNLPEKSGLEVLKEIKAVQPGIHVLVLTLHSEEEFAVRSLRAGADGYLTKESTSESLAEAVRKLLLGGKYISPSLAEKLALALETNKAEPPHRRLSDREYQVLLMILQGHGSTSIAANLNLSINTVSTYRTRILEKMGLKTNAELILYGLRNRLIE